jgi:hypothetical protein
MSNGYFTPTLNIQRESTLTQDQSQLAALLAQLLGSRMGQPRRPYTGFHPYEDAMFPWGIPEGYPREYPLFSGAEPSQTQQQNQQRPQQPTRPSGVVQRNRWGGIVSTSPPPPPGIGLTEWAAYLEGSGNQPQSAVSMINAVSPTAQLY